MPAADEPGQVRDQELAAPERAVGAEPGPVERHPDDRPVLAVVGQAGGDVRVVVLHPDQSAGAVGELERVLGGQVLRVQVVRDHLRVDVEQPPEMLDALGERAQRLDVLQIPDVLGDERVVLLGQAERALQLRAAGEHRPREGRPHGSPAPARSRGTAAAAFPGRAPPAPPSRRP